MKKLLFTFLVLTPFLCYAQVEKDSVTNRIHRQLNIFPQEKIYMHTDRNKYLSGEKLWFKAYLVSALSNEQANNSRYVYAELISPMDSVVNTVKIRPDSLGMFYGHIPLNDDLPEGHYMLRAYTQYMRNMEDDYLFSKAIAIYHPLSANYRFKNEMEVQNNKVNIAISYTDKKNGAKVNPIESKVLSKDKKSAVIHFNNEGLGHFSIDTKKEQDKQILLIETKIDNKVYKHYLEISSLSNDYDISFMPEGGNLPAGTNSIIAFRAVGADGHSEEITGTLYDDSDTEICKFESTVDGMGKFSVFPSSDSVRYYALCKSSRGIEKRFDLPLPKPCHSLQVNMSGERIYIGISQSPNITDKPLYLLVHLRGAVIYNTLWDVDKGIVTFNQDDLPSGVLNALLYDDEYNVLSERLIFSMNENELAKVSYQGDKPVYKSREEIKAMIQVSDVSDIPLDGDFSISVTNDTDMVIDTMQHIISELLLASDIKGGVGNLHNYINKMGQPTNIELVMLTHGWRRYDIPNVIKGKLTQPNKYPFEVDFAINGKVSRFMRSIKDGNVTIVARSDSAMFIDEVKTDKEGRFRFEGFEHPERFDLLLTATNSKGGDNVFLELNDDEHKKFPLLSNTFLPLRFNKEQLIDNDRKNKMENNFIARADQKWRMENGTRTVDLPLVEVTAQQMRKSKSPNYSPLMSSRQIILDKDIYEKNINTHMRLLTEFPSLSVMSYKKEVYYRGDLRKPTRLVIDNVLQEPSMTIFDIDIRSIGEMFVTPPEASIYGRVGNPLIVITTTKGGGIPDKKSENVRTLKLLGYQEPLEFYSPKYETREEKSNGELDLRTTIYWKPNLKLDRDGKANVNFYSSDGDGRYTVVMEGMGEDGHFIYKTEKIRVEN